MARHETPAEKKLRRVLKGEAIQRAPDPKPALNKILKKAKKGQSK